MVAINFGRKALWNGIGQSVDSPDIRKDWTKFASRIGLDWTVRKEPLVTMSHAQDIIDTNGTLSHDTRAYATVREDTNKILGVVKNDKKRYNI